MRDSGLSFISYVSKSQTKGLTQDILDELPSLTALALRSSKGLKDLIYEFISFQVRHTVSRYFRSKQISIPYIHYNSAGTEKREHKNKTNITRILCAMNPLTHKVTAHLARAVPTFSLPNLLCVSYIPSLQGISATSPLEPSLSHLNAWGVDFAGRSTLYLG